MDVRDRLTSFVKALPVAHRVTIVAALAVVAMLAIPFVTWITTPSYAVLYSGLDDVALAEVVEALDAEGVPYQLEGGGSRVLVPREQLYATRASLAGEGIGGASAPEGYELLDDQGLSVSDFRQRVDYRRALEGELARTLQAMSGVREATVHLVTPERELFAERQEPVTASVLLTTTRTLEQREIEAVTFLVASSVEGLETEHITVADAAGTVLHAPGDRGGVATSRNMRQTREYEQMLASDIGDLLQRVTGSPASVVVRAALNYDESETETERFDPDSQVVVREQTADEHFEGTGVAPGGTVGLDGGPEDAEPQESEYDKAEVLREYGVDRVTSRTVAAPGRVEGLSVAIVADDGSLTGTQVPEAEELEALVAAAVGLDEARGDTVAVTTLPFPVPEEPVAEDEPNPLLGYLPQAIGGLVLLVVLLLLFLMTRRRQVTVAGIERTPRAPEPLPADDEPEELSLPEPEPALVGTQLHKEVVELVDRQPEEIATLLRGWLADRRGP